MINPANNSAIDGKSLETLRQRSAEVGGNVVIETDQQVNHGVEVSDPAFGLLEASVYNEKNSNKSRRKDRRVDVDNLVTATDLAHQGLENLGADELTITKDYVELPAATTDSGHLVLESEVKFLDEKNGLKTTKAVSAWTPRITKIQSDPEADGGATTTTKQVVTAASAFPARTIATLSAVRTQIGEDKYLQVVKVLDSTRPVLVSQEEESSTGKKVTTTRTILDSAPTFDDDGTARFLKSVKQISSDRWLQTVREIDDSILSTTFQEYHPVEYTFPPYLDETTPFLIQTTTDDQILINTLRSAGQRLRVPCLFETTYHTTLPSLSSIFQFKPVDIELRIPEGGISERGVLTDGAVFTFKVNPSEAEMQKLLAQVQQGVITYLQYFEAIQSRDITLEFPPSDPTVTEYKALMGNTVLIADDMMRWKYNLYRRVKVWMRMPNLDLDLSGNISYS